MSSYVLTLEQLRAIMWDVTKAITGLPDYQILHAFQPNGQPGFEITQNTVYLNVKPQDSPIDKQQDTVYGPNDSLNAFEYSIYPRVFSVDFTCYGAIGYDIADTIRSRIVDDDIKELMSPSLIFPVPNTTTPTYAPYNFNDQYFDRTDLSVTINVGTLRTASVPYLQSAAIQFIPDVGKKTSFIIAPGGSIPAGSGDSLDFSDPNNSEYIPTI